MKSAARPRRVTRGRLANAGAVTLVLMGASAAVTSAFAQDQTGTGTGTAPSSAAAPAAAAAAPVPGSSLPYLGTHPAGAPGLLGGSASGVATPAPPVGVSVRLGDVGQVLSAAKAVGAVPTLAPAGLTITPTLGLSEEFNSNIFNSVDDRQSDFITSISPGILATLSTPSATGTLAYAPVIQFFAKNPSENNVGQFLNGSLNATLLPQTLLLSLGAYASEGSTSGGLAPGGASVVPKGDQTTTTGFYVQPTFQHRFEDIGTLQLSYALQYSSESGNSAFAPGAAQPFFIGSHSLANQGTAIFTTGPVLGRFNNTVSAIASEETGTGISDGAHQYVVADTLRYAVERRVYVFGAIGYENLFYPSIPVVQIQDGIWAVGFSLTPAPATSIKAGYGRIQGFDAPFVSAVIGLTPDTTLAVSYTDTLGTSLQFLQYALTNSLVDAAGNPINNATGAPLLLTNQLLSQQSGLFRSAIFSANVTTTWPRDSLSLGFFNEQDKAVANAPGTTGFSQNSWSGSVNWTHALTPKLTASSFFQVGETNSRAVSNGVSTVISAQVALTYMLTPTLSSSILYGFSDNSFAEGTALQNVVIVALQKTF